MADEPEEYTVPAAGSQVAGEDRVYVMLPNGQTGTMTRDAAGVAIANGQAYAVQPNEKVTSMEQRAVTGERMGSLGAGLYGGVTGLSAGLAPFMVPDATRREMQVASEDFGTAFETGNVAGSVAGMFAGPGRLAVGAGRAATGAIGARTALGRVGARAFGEALEGGIIGAGETAGRLRMRDDPVTAGKVMAGFGLGATIGGVMGTPAAGVGELSGFARRGLRRMSGSPDLDAAQRAMYGDALPGASKRAREILGDDAADAAYRGKPLDPQDAEVLAREKLLPPDITDDALEKMSGKEIFDRIPEANQRRLRMLAGANPSVKNAYELIDTMKTRARRMMLIEAEQEAAMNRVSESLASEASLFNEGAAAFHEALGSGKPKWLGKVLNDTPGSATADQVTHARMLIAKAKQELDGIALPSKEKVRSDLVMKFGPDAVNGRMVKQVRDQIKDDIGQRMGNMEAPKYARQLLDVIEASERALDVDGLSSKAVFENLDRTKRLMRKFSGPDVRTTDPLTQRVRALYNDDFVKALEDPDIWGPRAAAAQAKMNKAASDEFNTGAAAGKMFRDAGEGEPVYGDFVQKQVLDTAWVVQQLRGLEKPGGEQSWQMFRNFINKRKASMETALEQLDIDDGLRSRLQANLDSANRLNKSLDAAEQTVTEINRAKRLANSQRSGLEMAIVLGLVGGLPGFAAGRLAMGAQNVGPVMRYLASMERAAQASDGRLAQSMQKFFQDNWRKALGLKPTTVAKPATPGSVTGVARALEKGLGKAEKGAEAGYRATKGAFYSQIRPGEDKRKAYAKRVEELSAIASDPLAVEGHVMGVMGPTAADHPQMRAAMSQGLQDGARAILDRLPSKDFMGEYLMGQEDDVPVSDMEIDDFARMYDVYADPVSAMERFAEGKITPQEVDVLEATAPALFQRIKERVMETIAQDPKAISYEKKLSLGILLKIPTDASLTPRYVYTQQSLFHASRLDYAQGTEQGSRRTYNETGVHLSDDLKTPSQKLQLGFDR